MFDFIEDTELREQAQTALDAQLKEVNDGIQDKVDAAVEGLKGKNTELLSEKKTFQEKLAKFSDISDPEKALEALSFLQENEDAQLIKAGRVDEVIAKRTSQMKIDQDAALSDLADKLVNAETSSKEFKGLYESKIMDDELRAVAHKAGIRSEAITDILLRARNIFSLGADGSVEARDSKNALVKNDDGVVVSPGVWMESLKTSSPHYWPTSEGAGAIGSSIAGDVDTTAKLVELAKKGDMAGYRLLRGKMASGA